MKKLAKVLLTLILIVLTVGGGFAFYSTQSTHPMAYQIRKGLGLDSQSWNVNLVNTYVELRLATRRYGQKTPKAQSTRLAILANYNYTPETYALAVDALKKDYQSWSDFQARVVKEFKDLENEIRQNSKGESKTNSRKLDETQSEKTQIEKTDPAAKNKILSLKRPSKENMNKLDTTKSQNVEDKKSLLRNSSSFLKNKLPMEKP